MPAESTNVVLWYCVCFAPHRAAQGGARLTLGLGLSIVAVPPRCAMHRRGGLLLSLVAVPPRCAMHRRGGLSEQICFVCIGTWGTATLCQVRGKVGMASRHI